MEQKTDVDGTILLGNGDDPSGQNIIHQTDQPSLMMDMESGNQADKKLSSESMIKDGDTENFMKDVIEASESVAVLVDFWAPWCGPCKTLGPILEKLVNQAGGLVKLVKINVDENQQLAAQMRVQSIPAVYAFQKGQPVDGFTGAVSESQIKAFFDKLLDGAVPPLEAAIRQGNAALEEGDGQSALSIFESIRDTDPNNPGAISGQIRSLVCLGQAEPITEIKKSLSNDLKSNPEISSALAAFELATLAVENQKEGLEIETLRAELVKNPDSNETRYDYARALLGLGNTEEALDELLLIIEKDQNWNDNAARTQLLNVFEALGPSDPITLDGRRRLSSILFA